MFQLHFYFYHFQDSGSEGFEKAYQQSVIACEAFVNKVKSGEI